MELLLKLGALLIAVFFGIFGFLRWRLQRRERRERAGEERFRRVLARMKKDRAVAQTDAAQLLRARRPEAQSAINSHLFALPTWIHDVPLPLEELKTKFTKSDAFPIPVTPTAGLPAAPVPYDSFSQCIQKLAPPKEFNDYPHYRLLAIESKLLQFSKTKTSYFKKIDFGQYLEYRWFCERWPNWLRRSGCAKLWGTISTPADYMVLAGVSTLTLLHDGANMRFIMHQRGQQETAFAMGTFHVAPAGEFQPACEAPTSFELDLDIWNNIMREYGEELGGQDDYDGHSNELFNYHLSPYRELCRGRQAGNIRLYYFGTGLDPLTLQGEILTVAVFRERIFNRIFPNVLARNSEGKFNNSGGKWGTPFNESECKRYLATNTLASGQLLIKLALLNYKVFRDCLSH